MKVSSEELKFRQQMTLEEKIATTAQRIEEWYDRWEGKVYVAFSGGKDSTVLLHVVRIYNFLFFQMGVLSLQYSQPFK